MRTIEAELFFGGLPTGFGIATGPVAVLVDDVLVVDELEELEEEVDVLELEELEEVVELEDVDEAVLVEERADDEVAVALEDARPDELLELLVVDEGGAAFVLALEDAEVCVEEVWDSAP